MKFASAGLGVLLSAFFSPAASAATEEDAPSSPEPSWELIYEDATRTIQVETTTLTRIRNNVTATFVTIFKTPQDSYPNWTMIDEPVTYWYEKIQFRCDKAEFNRDYERFEDEDQKVIQTTISRSVDGQLSFVGISLVEDSVAKEIQFEAACER